MKIGPLPEYGLNAVHVEFLDHYRAVRIAYELDDGSRKAFHVRLPKEWDDLLDKRWRERHDA